jgi:translation initiation factor IF-2
MADRLVKIAKELNVGLSTIVDFLATKGFSIENKPTALVSDEMHAMLLKEFSNSMAEKEKADQIIIGRSYGKEEQKPGEDKSVKSLFSIPKLADIEKPKEIIPDPEIPAIVTDTENKEEIFSARKEAPQLKVLGKIDLEKPKATPKVIEGKNKQKDKKLLIGEG